MNTLKTNTIKTNSLGKSKPKYQEKSITITENGSSEIVADKGYDALGKVNVEVDINSSAEDYEYFDMLSLENYVTENNGTGVFVFFMMYYTTLMKWEVTDKQTGVYLGTYITSKREFTYTGDDYYTFKLVQFAVNTKVNITDHEGQILKRLGTIEESLGDMLQEYKSAPRITRDEFYELYIPTTDTTTE